VYRHGDRHVETYTISKPRTSWMGLYLFLGLCIGMALGLVFDSMIVGMVIGMGACIAAGAVMDSKENEKRSNVTGESVKVKRSFGRKKSSKGE